MRNEFPFLPAETDEGTVFRPIIRVRVEYLGKVMFLLFLIDSGSDISLLGTDVAKELGMNFDEGRKKEVRGIHGHKIQCVEKKVLLSVPGFDAPFESALYIARELKLPHNLLGRDNFFNQFRVGFDQKERKLFLDDRNGR